MTAISIPTDEQCDHPCDDYILGIGCKCYDGRLDNDDDDDEDYPDNYEDDYEVDEFEAALSECGFSDVLGFCSMAGTEFCDWECPLADMFQAK